MQKVKERFHFLLEAILETNILQQVFSCNHFEIKIVRILFQEKKQTPVTTICSILLPFNGHLHFNLQSIVAILCN